MKKPRIGVFIDAGNLYHTSARIGWRIDFIKLKNLLSHACDLSFINYHIVVPREDDSNYAKTLTHIQKASMAFTICQKPMKYIWSDEEKREIKKGDVELIKEYVEYGVTTNPDLSAGATLTRLIVAKAVTESSTSQTPVDKAENSIIQDKKTYEK